MASQVIPGQFVSIYSNEKDKLLPRPISICEVGEGTLRLVYRVVGKGTKELSQAQAGKMFRLMGPLGNGYEEEYSGSAPILVGGGVGIPPMLQLAKELSKKENVTPVAVLGYRDSETFLKEDFEQYAQVYVSTDDGSLGVKGTVVDALDQNHIHGDALFACGPLPMLRGVKEWCQKEGISCTISLEERMACGIGACLGCVCDSTEVDSHSKVKNKRVCKDGPVFHAGDICL